MYIKVLGETIKKNLGGGGRGAVGGARCDAFGGTTRCAMRGAICDASMTTFMLTRRCHSLLAVCVAMLRVPVNVHSRINVGVTNYVDGDKHTVGLGLGFELGLLSSVFPQPLMIDFAGQMVVMPKRSHRKLQAADPVGDYVAGGAIFGGAVTTRWRF